MELSYSCHTAHTENILLYRTTDISFRMSVFHIFVSPVFLSTFFSLFLHVSFLISIFLPFLHFNLSSLQLFILSNLLSFLFIPSFCLYSFLLLSFELSCFQPCFLLPSIKDLFLSGSAFFLLSFSLLCLSFLSFVTPFLAYSYII
jgi:hypothetical protein